MKKLIVISALVIAAVPASAGMLRNMYHPARAWHPMNANNPNSPMRHACRCNCKQLAAERNAVVRAWRECVSLARYWA